jgi:hypothetical protein
LIVEIVNNLSVLIDKELVVLFLKRRLSIVLAVNVELTVKYIVDINSAFNTEVFEDIILTKIVFEVITLSELVLYEFILIVLAVSVEFTVINLLNIDDVLKLDTLI